jgi:tellurite methyltransferase
VSNAVEFFDSQFARQLAAGELTLNPFEQVILPQVRGTVLDLGCGLGNLALALARRGNPVTALDASPAAIAHLVATAKKEDLDLTARRADLADVTTWPADSFDSVVSIGLFMFFGEGDAWRLLRAASARVRPGGYFAVNVLTVGTSYLAMFGDAPYHLFDPVQLRSAFPGWTIEQDEGAIFSAPGATEKHFVTLLLRRPATPSD